MDVVFFFKMMYHCFRRTNVAVAICTGWHDEGVVLRLWFRFFKAIVQDVVELLIYDLSSHLSFERAK